MDRPRSPALPLPLPPLDQAHDTLAAARLHVQALTECGLPAEALLAALLEQCNGGQQAFSPSALSPNQPSRHRQHPFGHHPRLSVSTTSSASTGRFSRRSSVTTQSSVSGHSSFTANPLHAAATVPSHPQPVKASSSSSSSRAYWCTSCDTKLQRKFDWKRHEDEFHERYKRYPCPDCNRVFWGANTFNQHHKSRHGCTSCPHADKVVRYTRQKRAWGCGFCAALLPSSERYFEHVALHYESGRTKAHWEHALLIYGLLHQPIVHEAWKQLQASKYGHVPQEHHPLLGWDPQQTGRAQGFLENECPGQLQDRLEFFDPACDDVHAIVRLADELAIVITATDDEQSLHNVPEEHTAAVWTTRATSVTASRSGTIVRRRRETSQSIDPSSHAVAFQANQQPTYANPPPPTYEPQPMEDMMVDEDVLMPLPLFSAQQQAMGHDAGRMDMVDWTSLSSTVVDETMVGAAAGNGGNAGAGLMPAPEHHWDARDTYHGYIL